MPRLYFVEHWHSLPDEAPEHTLRNSQDIGKVTDVGLSRKIVLGASLHIGCGRPLKQLDSITAICPRLTFAAQSTV
jgi:hypothetical protein